MPAPLSVSLTLPYPPSTNRYYRNVGGHMVLSAEGRAYKKAVADAALVAGVRTPFDGSVGVAVSVYRPQKSGDLDGRLKGLLDSLQGALYLNDSQVVEIHAYRYDDRANPRAVVCVTAVPRPAEVAAAAKGETR